MSQNTEQNVRTRDAQVTALFDAIDTFPSNRSSDDRMGYKRQASAQNLAERHILEAEARGAEEQRRKDAEGCEPWEFEEPEYHDQGMGCGLEDRGIRDRYQAMEYGWDQAVERCIERIPEELYAHPANVAALEARIASLKDAEQLARADAEASKARVKVLEEALSAAVSALEQVTDGERGGYNARNGKFVSLQMSDGERADIIHSDVTTECEGALETARAALTREGGV